MTAISPFSQSPEITPLFGRRQPRREAEPLEAIIRSRQDRAEVSDRAKWMSRVAELTAARADVVSRVRGQIASGEYLRDGGKIDVAVDRLLAQLVGGPAAIEADANRRAC